MSILLLLTVLVVGAAQDVLSVVSPEWLEAYQEFEIAPESHAEDAPVEYLQENNKTSAEMIHNQPARDTSFEALFTELSFRYTGRGYQDRKFRYKLFVPAANSPDERFPLMVWLHGYGENGNDNRRHLKFIDKYVLQAPFERERYPFFVLALQCPEENPVWTTSSADADDMMNVLIPILEQTLRDYPVDRNRVSLTGVSAGGTGCWELAMRHPELFSCVAPTGSDGGDVSRVDRLIGVPVWAFHSTRDGMTSIGPVRNTVKALQSAGGIVKLTEIDSSHHYCWIQAFTEHDLLDWLLTQRRGQGSFATHWGWLRHQYLNWDYLWPRLIPISILLLGLVAWRHEIRRRRIAELAKHELDWEVIFDQARPKTDAEIHPSKT